MALFVLTALFLFCAGLLIFVGIVSERRVSAKRWAERTDLSPEARVLLRAAGYPVP